MVYVEETVTNMSRKNMVLCAISLGADTTQGKEDSKGRTQAEEILQLK
jgi:hypothetical protein